jgi:hypothetical protein
MTPEPIPTRREIGVDNRSIADQEPGQREIELDDLEVEAVQHLGHSVVLPNHRLHEVHRIGDQVVIDAERDFEQLSLGRRPAFRRDETVGKGGILGHCWKVRRAVLLDDMGVEGPEPRTADQVDGEEVGDVRLLLKSGSLAADRPDLVQDPRLHGSERPLEKVVRTPASRKVVKPRSRQFDLIGRRSSTTRPCRTSKIATRLSAVAKFCW